MALPAQEDFTGSAGALTTNWTQQRTTRRVNRDGTGSGQQDAADTADVLAFWSGDGFQNDHYSQVVIVVNGNGAGGFSVNASVRASGTGDAAWNAYDFYTNGSSGAGNTELAVVVNGAATVLRNYTTTLTVGDVIKLTAQGTTIEAFKNSVSIGTQVDGTIPSGGAPGVGSFYNGTTFPKFDAFEGNDIAAPVEILRSRKLSTQQRMVA